MILQIDPGDSAVTVFNQVRDEVEDFGLDRYGLVVAFQLEPTGIQRATAKPIEHRP
jgi:hypothetical protein